MKLYTVVVHNLQMATIFLHAHLQVVYYKFLKFHKNPISRLGGVALTRYMDGRTDRVIPLLNFSYLLNIKLLLSSTVGFYQR
jgi:hypothetical protein